MMISWKLSFVYIAVSSILIVSIINYSTEAFYSEIQLIFKNKWLNHNSLS
jgi:hypothetical protein